jgi:outer membrane protein
MEAIILFNNKIDKLLIPGAIMLGFILLTAGVFWVISINSVQIGMVDMNRLTSESTLYSKIKFEVQIKSQELQKEYANAKTADEKNRIQTEYQQYSMEKDKEFSKKAHDIVAKIAKNKGIKVVANSQTLIYSGTDLTDDVIKELNKK